MRKNVFAAFSVFLGFVLSISGVDAASEGHRFIASHDEIVAKAKKEGKLRAISSLDGGTFKPMMESFSKKYPFIEIRME